jgi:transcriptional regulator with XRE-family HTH domain
MDPRRRAVRLGLRRGWTAFLQSLRSPQDQGSYLFSAPRAGLPAHAARRPGRGQRYQTVGYLERGEYTPSLHLALRIAAFFGVPVETVFSVEPFPTVLPDRRAAAG